MDEQRIANDKPCDPKRVGEYMNRLSDEARNVAAYGNRAGIDPAFSFDLPIASRGIELRDQFAMAALRIASKEMRRHSRLNPGNPNGWWTCIAEDAYVLADAMLEARKRVQEKPE